MALTNEQELISFVKDLMGASYEKVSSNGFQKAYTHASSELRWSIPTSNSFREFWIIERTKRYVTGILLFESAHKFQYKKINLQHRFQQYFKLLEMYDAEFYKAIEDNPMSFDNLDIEGISGAILGSYLTTGFQYDTDGEDVTYLGA